MTQPFQNLLHHLGRTVDLERAAAVLEWDLETYMPPGAADARARQIATLREMAHELLVSDETERLLDNASSDGVSSDDDSFSAPLLRVLRRDLERARCIPPRLVADLAESSTRAREAWKQARDADEFATFAPHLERLLDLTLEKAEAVGYEDDPYDALLDEFEPEMRTSTVRTVFGDLRRDLVPIVETIKERPQVDDAFLHRDFDPDAQWAFGMDAIREIGYDFSRGRQDRSTHPFSTSFSVTDCRITTRIQRDYFPTAFFGTMHEAGHALYEQGVDASFERTPLAEGTSLAMHESQSRLWENQVGRSRAYWSQRYPKLQRAFPVALRDVDVESFYRGINRVEPSLIRVEADEVTYNLHVMLRFELETDLVSGRLSVADVPEAWNQRMEEYLGIQPTGHRDGALQDIHWSLGAIGYFPTYALGTIISSQLAQAAEHDLGPLDGLIETGGLPELREWLRTHVHRWGRARSAGDLLEHITGGGIDAGPWLRYIRSKYGELYDF